MKISFITGVLSLLFAFYIHRKKKNSKLYIIVVLLYVLVIALLQMGY